jgi:hypothetical protein
MAGYSGTPLASKLGIKPGCALVQVNAPAHLAQLLAPLPEGVQLAAKPSAGTQLLHLFSTRRAELQKLLPGYRKTLGPEAVLWVSWPKKAAKVDTDITEHTVRELALPLGFVDVKVCAVDEVWSGLKLVVRKELR